MFNKKQINLKTISLDWPTALYNSQHFQARIINPKGSLLMTSKAASTAKCSQTSNLLKPQNPKSKNSRFQKKQNAGLNNIKHLQVNRYKVQSFLNIKKHTMAHSLYQKFPSRDNKYKNNNAYRYYLNSDAAHRNYTESIAELKRIHTQINDDSPRKIKIARPQSCKTRNNTLSVQNSSKQTSSFKRPHSSAVFRSLKKDKGLRCTTVPEFSPWETNQDKYIAAEW